MNTIRPVAPIDAEKILKIYAPYVTDTSVSFETELPSVKQFAERIENTIKIYPYLVCEIDGEIAGFAYASKHRERAAYKYSADVSIYIASAYHRQGMGKKLYTALFDLLKKQGIYTVYAGIALPNEASIALHKSLGFAEVGIYHNVGYKHGRWHNVVWLEKPLREYDKPEEKEKEDL